MTMLTGNVQERRREGRHGELSCLQPGGVEREVAWGEMERRGRASYRRCRGRRLMALKAINAGDFLLWP